MIRISTWALAGVLALAAVPVMGDEPATSPPVNAEQTRRVAADRAAVEEAMFADLLAGTVSVYLEGNTTTPFLEGATFTRRLRIADKEFLIFASKDGEKVIIRTQTIVAVRVKAK